MLALRGLRVRIPESAWQHLWFVGPFSTSMGSRKIVLQHPGVQVENQVFWTGTFRSEALALEVLSRYAQNFKTFIDVGANTGVYALSVASRQPGVRVLALEPAPTNYALLQANIDANALDIAAIQAAASESNGSMDLFDFPGHSYSASLEGTWREGTTVRKVEVVRIDSLLRSRGGGGPALLKIDVEGHEPSVLRGMGTLIDGEEPPSFLLEILRDSLFAEIVSILPTSRFCYYFCDEVAGTLADFTPSAALSAPLGNYFVVPRVARDALESCAAGLFRNGTLRS
jgi:FkbM family methyltransferase